MATRTTLEQRITTLEVLSRLRINNGPGSPPAKPIAQSTAAELEELKQKAKGVTELAEAAGDLRLVLASLNTRCRLLEADARLHGELKETNQTNVFAVHLDPETAKRITETYIARRRRLESID